MPRSQYPHADLIGKKFGRLTVLSLADKDPPRVIFYNCLCECGTETVVAKQKLLNGDVLSCGCLRREIARGKVPSAIANGGYISGTMAVMLTSTKPFSSNVSGYRGVSWDSHIHKYTAQITFKRKKYHLGVFDDPAIAHEAYLEAKEKLHAGFLEEIGWNTGKKED